MEPWYAYGIVLEYLDDMDYSKLKSLAESDSNEITVVLSTTDEDEFLKFKVKLRPPCYFVRDTRPYDDDENDNPSEVFSQYYVIGSGETSDTYTFLLVNTIRESNSLYLPK